MGCLLWASPPKASCSPAGGLGQLPTVPVVEEPSHSSWGASGGSAVDQGWDPEGSGIVSTLGRLGRRLNGTEILPFAAVTRCLGFFVQHRPPGWGDGGDVSVGRRGSRCRRWSMASRTSPAPSATAPVCASWPSAPARELSSCILPFP